MNKTRIAQVFIFIFLSAGVSLAMDSSQYEKKYTIAKLFHAGYLDDWEDNFSGAEVHCLQTALENKIKGKLEEANAQFFSCARRGSPAAMYHLGLIVMKDHRDIARDWFRLAYLLHFQKSGKSHDLARKRLRELGVKIPELNDALSLSPNPTMLDKTQRHTHAEQSVRDFQQKLSEMFYAAKQMMASINNEIPGFEQINRWERVSAEIEQWFPNKQKALKSRATAFIILCAPTSPRTVEVASKLENARALLGNLECALLCEMLVKKIIKTHSPIYGSLDDFHKLKNLYFNEVLKEVYLKRPRGLFGLKNDLSEFERRCSLITNQDDLYKVAELLTYKKTPYDFPLDKRYARAAQLALLADTPDSHALLCDLYTKELIGKDLGARERLLRMQEHNNKAEPTDRQRALNVVHHFSLGEFEVAVRIGEELLNNGTPFKGLLYGFVAASILSLTNGNLDRETFHKVYGYAKLAVLFGDKLMQPMLNACEQSNFLIAEDDGATLSSDDEQKKPTVETKNEVTTATEKSSEQSSKRPRKKEIKIAKNKRKIERLVASIKENMPDLEPKEASVYPINYANDKVKEQFEMVAQTQKKKIDELFLDIMNKPWGTEGAGKPEILKNHGKFGGMNSRRIDDENRLVYDFVDGVIVIYSCVGHYL